jgi:hypothetical protein
VRSVAVRADWSFCRGGTISSVLWPSGDTLAILEVFFVLGAVVVIAIPVMVCLWREGGWLDRRRQR